MSPTNTHKSFFAVCFAILFVLVSCKKEPKPVKALPLIEYSFWIYDSVEGTKDVEHFAINKIIKLQYDPNVDKCYMAKNDLINPAIDTFDRSPNWKRGYVNRADLMHRIIFNGDTITIHHNVQNQIGELGFRYTHGIKQ